MGVYQGLIVEVISKLLLKPALVCKAGGIENDAQRLHKRNVGFVFLADNLHYEKFPDGSVKCIEDEIPFEVPSGWEWERLGNISIIERGGSPRPIKNYITSSEDGVNWIKIGDAEKGGMYIYSTKEKITLQGALKSRAVHSGDFLLTNSMSFGRPYILKTDGCIHDGWLVIENTQSVFSQDYLYYTLSSSLMFKTLSILAGGSTVDNLNIDRVKSLLFPIPPISEQNRIAKKADLLLQSVDNITASKDNITKQLEKVKSKILDLAIRGKLVPQDPNDEPASVLLERIRAEKEELIKQGKIKRDKGEGVIFKGGDNSHYEKIGDKVTCIDDEIPFEVPEMWAWARLSNIAEITMGSSPAGENICNDKKYLEFHQGKISFKEKIIGYSGQHTKEITKVAKPNSVLLCVRAPVGEVNITNREICIGRGLSAIHPYLGMEAEFMFYWLQPFKQFLNGKATGSTFSAITSEVVRNLLIPLPPISEQKRIVEAVTSAFSLISKIEESLA